MNSTNFLLFLILCNQITSATGEPQSEPPKQFDEVLSSNTVQGMQRDPVDAENSAGGTHHEFFKSMPLSKSIMIPAKDSPTLDSYSDSPSSNVSNEIYQIQNPSAQNSQNLSSLEEDNHEVENFTEAVQNHDAKSSLKIRPSVSESSKISSTVPKNSHNINDNPTWAPLMRSRRIGSQFSPLEPLEEDALEGFKFDYPQKKDDEEDESEESEQLIFENEDYKQKSPLREQFAKLTREKQTAETPSVVEPKKTEGQTSETIIDPVERNDNTLAKTIDVLEEQDISPSRFDFTKKYFELDEPTSDIESMAKETDSDLNLTTGEEDSTTSKQKPRSFRTHISKFQEKQVEQPEGAALKKIVRSPAKFVNPSDETVTKNPLYGKDLSSISLRDPSREIVYRNPIYGKTLPKSSHDLMFVSNTINEPKPVEVSANEVRVQNPMFGRPLPLRIREIQEQPKQKFTFDAPIHSEKFTQWENLAPRKPNILMRTFRKPSLPQQSQADTDKVSIFYPIHQTDNLPQAQIEKSKDELDAEFFREAEDTEKRLEMARMGRMQIRRPAIAESAMEDREKFYSTFTEGEESDLSKKDAGVDKQNRNVIFSKKEGVEDFSLDGNLKIHKII